MDVTVVKEIAETITKRIIDKKSFLTDISLTNGKMGAILLLFYSSRFFSNYDYQTEAEKILDECFDLFKEPSKNYYNNLAGFGIGLLALVKDDYIEFTNNDIFDSIDELLTTELYKRLDNENIGGFYDGAASLLPYFLEREKFGFNIEATISVFITKLLIVTSCSNQGNYLESNLFNDGRVYLSSPHGSGALIFLLTKVFSMGYEKERIKNAIGGYISFVINNLNDFIKDGYYIDDIWKEEAKSRLSLVYGDLGVGYALLNAGIVFGNNLWYNKGLKMLEDSASRKEKVDTYATDANIIYGASGLSLFFQTVFELTKKQVFSDTASYWKNKVIKSYDQDDDLLGFHTDNNQWIKSTNVSFNEGLCGIGMFCLNSSFTIPLKSFSFLL